MAPTTAVLLRRLSDEPMSMGQICDRIGYDPYHLRDALDTMEEKGMVEKTDDGWRLVGEAADQWA